MARSGPISMTLPPFAGATRKLILWNLAVFFGLAILMYFAPRPMAPVVNGMALSPVGVAHLQIWRLVTYAFLNGDILSTAFAMLTLWFVGSLLEGAYGPRWLYELYFTSVIGGAALATAISFAHLPHLSPEVLAIGPYAGIFGLMIAIGAYFGDQEFLLLFVLRIKARYLVAIYILIDLAILLKSADGFSALLHLCGAVCGFCFIRFAPRKGLAFGLTERWYSLRNEYYRNKRRRAARKFEVYMRKQDREVHFDKDGRYVDPDKDPTDKRWMN